MSDDIQEKDQSSRRKFIGPDGNELNEYSGGVWLVVSGVGISRKLPSRASRTSGERSFTCENADVPSNWHVVAIGLDTTAVYCATQDNERA